MTDTAPLRPAAHISAAPPWAARFVPGGTPEGNRSASDFLADSTILGFRRAHSTPGQASGAT